MNDRQIAQLVEQGLNFHRSGNLQQAEAAYRTILQHRPGHPDALHLLGVIAHQVGQHPAAIQMIHQALQSAPKLQAAWNNLGEALRANNQVEDAIKAYQNAIALQPNFSDDSLHYADRLPEGYPERNNPFRMLIDEAGFVPGEDLVFGSDGMPHGVGEALRQALFPPFAGQELSLDEFVAGYCVRGDRAPGAIELRIDTGARRVDHRVVPSSPHARV